MQELEFLADSSVITVAQLSTFLSQLPSQTPLHAPLASPASTTNGVSSPPPTTQLGNTSLNEKTNSYYQPSPSPSPAPPPAYVAPPTVASIAAASALYEYRPSDAGDLAILPNDRIIITEFMNADWAKGRNERTGQEGIFPRSYVNIIDEKGAATMQHLPPPSASSNYGNVPLDVAQSGSSGGGGIGGRFSGMGGGEGNGQESKVGQHGKKFGKKLGNAGESYPPCLCSAILGCRGCMLMMGIAVFGAGATIGSNIVNGIF